LFEDVEKDLVGEVESHVFGNENSLFERTKHLFVLLANKLDLVHSLPKLSNY
jgi:hypothetical protein